MYKKNAKPQPASFLGQGWPWAVLGTVQTDQGRSPARRTAVTRQLKLMTVRSLRQQSLGSGRRFQVRVEQIEMFAFWFWNC